jgi:hypothetical protein
VRFPPTDRLTSRPVSRSASRPTPRPWHAATHLAPVALAVWPVALDRLDRARVLPPQLEPVVVRHAGDDVAMASIVGFYHHGFRFRAVPFVTMSGGQVDIRLHVQERGNGDTGVFFLDTMIDSPWALLPRLLWSLPGRRAPVVMATESTAARDRLRWRAGAGSLAVELELETGRRATGLPTSAEIGAPSITDPMVGWFLRRSGRLARLSVWHHDLALRAATLTGPATRAGPLEALGLVAPGAPPLAAFVGREADFEVHTPPTRVP